DPTMNIGGNLIVTGAGLVLGANVAPNVSSAALVGGYNGSSYSNNVHVATIQTAGISAWTSINPLPVALRDPAVVVGTNIIYVLGGRNATQVFDAIYYAAINADGTIGAWQTSDVKLPTALWGHSAVFVNGFIYVAGGSNIASETSALNTVYYTKLKADNTLSPFSAGTNLPATRNMQSMVTYNNKIYLIGGYDQIGTKTNTVYFAAPESTGPTGPWLSETPLPVAISNHTSVVSNGLIMVLGGATASALSNAVYYANSDQAPPLTWVTSTNSMFDYIKDGSAFQGNGQVIYTGGTSQAGNILSNCRYSTLTLTSSYVNRGVFVSCPFFELGAERLINSMAFTAAYNATYANCQVSYRLAGSDKIWGDWTALTSTSPIIVNQTKQFVQYSVFFTGQTTYNVTFSDMALTTPGTPLTGNLDAMTTFTAAASPYVVFSNISFTSGTHTFQAGTTVLFSPNTGMSVSQASVVCNGTAADSVKFLNLGVEAGKWNGIFFDAYSNSGVSSQLFYTVIAGAGFGSYNANLYCNQTQQPYLSQCNIRYADGNGIRLVNSDPSFQNTVIKGNTENGINLDNSNPTIAICTISYNGGAGIYANTIASIMNGTAIHHNLYGIRYTSPNFSISQPTGSPTVTDNTFNGIALNGGDINTSDKTWNSLPYDYFLLGTVRISQSSANVRLTIKPGNTIKVANGTQIQVGYYGGGELYAVGTADSTITFTPSSGVAGGWNGIYFTNYSDEYGGHSQMAYCIIEKGNDYNVFSESTIQPDMLYHCTIRNAVLDGAKYTNSTMAGAIANCQFMNNGRYPLYSYITSTDQIHTNNTYTGNGINKIVIYGGSYSSDRTITNDGIPYYVLNTIYISKSAANARLTIEPGVTLEFAEGTQIQVGQGNCGGELYAQGTAGSPIIFKAYNDTPGGWGGINFTDYNDNYAGTSKLEYCTVKQGFTYNINCEYSTQPTLDHCIISNSASHGIIESSSSAQIHDCQFLNNNGYPLKYNDPDCNSHLLNNIYSGNIMNYIALSGGYYQADRTFYNDGVPYHVLSSVYTYCYQGMSRITIKPGVTMAFAPGTQLQIGANSSYGAELYAEGTADNAITFKPFNNSTGGWGGIYFQDPDNYGATSSMKYCKIEKGATYNVSCNNTSQILIDHCVLDKSAGKGLNIYNSSIVISNSAISNSGLFGIDASTFSGTIDNCVISNSDSTGINASSFTGSILNSTISNSGSFGVNASSFTGSILNSTISNSGSNGIVVSNSSGQIHNCQFLNNNGYPLKYSDVSCDFHLFGNTYIGNAPNYIAISGGDYSTGNRIFYNDGIPYHVLGDLRITNSARITIKPGTTLAFGSGKSLQIGFYSWGSDQGDLYAEGTADSVITFKPYNNLIGGWGGLYFSYYSNYSGATSSLKYCKIEKAAVNNILCESTTQPAIEHCELTQSAGNGLQLINSSPLIIRNSSFANNALNGIL
ncbi:MAG: right-handed parallel beta-helix repeat-containing protein, partial [Bacteroidota bacterium]